MQNEMPVYQQLKDEIDLEELASVVWRGRKFILLVTGLFTTISLIVALLTPNQYEATVVVYPAETDDSSLLGGMASKIGGVASLAGLNVGQDKSGESKAAMEIMLSWGFIEKFITDNELAADLFAADGWDRETNKLSYDSSLYNSQQKVWVRNPPEGKTIDPTSWELYNKFIEHLSVSTNTSTDMTSVSIEHYSPALAKQWVELYVLYINQYMGERKLVQVNNNILYLQDQVEKTSIADMKEVFYLLIEEQIKNKMLAEATPEYAFITVSQAMLPEEASSPYRVLICLLGAFLGLILAILTVLIMHFFIKQDAADKRS